MSKKQKNISLISVAQPALIGYSYDEKLIKNKYTAFTSGDTIKDVLISYPYVCFSVPTQAQLIIGENRLEPLHNNTIESKLIEQDQIGSYVIISSSTPANPLLGWEPLLENDHTAVVIDNNPLYKFLITAHYQLLQFIPENAKIWGVLNLLTTDKMSSPK